jgi:hypothetical protein
MCELADKLREKIIELFHRRRIGRMLQGKILSVVLWIGFNEELWTVGTQKE